MTRGIKTAGLMPDIIAELYWQEGKTLREIGEIYHCRPQTVKDWATRYSIKLRTRSESVKLSGRNIRYRPNLILTNNLGYLIGAIRGDGSVTHNRVCLVTTDPPFASAFEGGLKKIGLNPHKILVDSARYNPKAKPLWHIYAISRLFAVWYNNLTWSALFANFIERRDLGLSFFQGFYEAEGSLWHPKPKICLTNKNRGLLESVKAMMEQFGYEFRLYESNNNGGVQGRVICRIILHKKDQVKCLLSEIQPCILRKQWEAYW